jgi:hypothetical protein
MTPGERGAQIDRDLDASLGVFDGRMRDEQATLAGQRNGRGGSGGNAEGKGGAGSEDASSGEAAGQNGSGQNGDKSGTSGSGTNSNGQQGGGGEANGQNGKGQGQTPGGSGDRGGGGGVGGGGARGGSGPSTVPADIPDGSDDDVVARQLREAAMKETDPELREKLWQEYRNYKKGAS